jgi:hypothetical protein
MIKIEIWKDLVGYEGLYQISSEGRVRKLTRRVVGHCVLRGDLYLTYPRLVKVVDWKVWLRKDGVQKFVSIKKIFLKMFGNVDRE